MSSSNDAGNKETIKTKGVTETDTDTVKQTTNKGKKSKKQDMDESVPVFRLKPINGSNEAIMKYVGFLKKEEKLGDEVVELDKPIHPEYELVGRHAIPIKNINNYEMVGRIYRCNIIGSYIVTGRRYPLMYLTVTYSRTIVTGALLQILISIDMDREDKKKITNNKQYVNLQFKGNWIQHTDCDDELPQNFDKMLTVFLQDEATNIYCSDKDIGLDRTAMSDDEIGDWIDNYISNERVHYDKFLKQTDYKFKNLDTARDYLLDICRSDRFYNFLVIAMKCRDIHRRKEAHIDDVDIDYVIPKEVTKLSSIRQQIIDSGELIMDD